MFLNTGFGQVPGIGVTAESFESAITWGPPWLRIWTNGRVAGASRDAGNTPTTVLRAGLVMGRVTATGSYVPHSATATDGSQLAVGVLPLSYRMVDAIEGSNQDRFGPVLVGGPVIASALIGLTPLARAQLSQNFIFDDDYDASFGWCGKPLFERAVTSNTTLVAGDVGTLFTNTGAAGAVTFTLPALQPGLGPFWFLVVANQNVTVTAAGTDRFIWTNSAAITSLTFSTANQLIGGFLKVYANQAGTQWIAERSGSGAHTITAA